MAKNKSKYSKQQEPFDGYEKFPETENTFLVRIVQNDTMFPSLTPYQLQHVAPKLDKIFRDDETILGNELYLVFDQTEKVLKDNSNADQNLIRISHDVIIKKPGYMLKADVLEIDLITKNTKVYMNSLKDKVQAKSELK